MGLSWASLETSVSEAVGDPLSAGDDDKAGSEEYDISASRPS